MDDMSMEENSKSEPEMSAEEAARTGEEASRRQLAEAVCDADVSWLGIVEGQLEGSSGETMTITLDAVMTQRMKAVSRKFGKTAEEFLMPYLRMATYGDYCYQLRKWERHPSRRVYTVEEIDRLKEMSWP